MDKDLFGGDDLLSDFIQFKLVTDDDNKNEVEIDFEDDEVEETDECDVDIEDDDVDEEDEDYENYDDNNEVVSNSNSELVANDCSDVSSFSIRDNFENMSGAEFENLILQLVRKMGFEAQTTKASGDGGIDIVAHNTQPFLEGQYIIQCKRWNSSIGEPALRDLYGVVMSERANKGILVTTSYFTPSAISFAAGKPLELIDGNKLQNLLNKYDLTLGEIQESALSIEEAWRGANNYVEELTCSYDKISLLRDELLINPNNYHARHKLIGFLSSAIFRMHPDRHWYDPSGINVLINECRKHISFVEKNKACDKRLLDAKNLSIHCDAQMYILQGNFEEALKRLLKLNEWLTTFDDCDEAAKANFIWNIIQIYNILKLPQKAKLIYEKNITTFENLFFDRHESAMLFLSGMSVYGDEDFYEKRFETMSCNEFLQNFYDIHYNKWSRFAFESNFYLDKDKIYFDLNEDVKIRFNTFGEPIGLEGFPTWEGSVIENMEQTRKRVELLY